jgi:DNA-binding NarL/FixJ family response regulator
MIRVLIADDHPVVSEGLCRLLREQADITVIGTVENGREAVRRAVDEQPDVVVMDNAMPELNGIEATELIRKRSPGTRVLMLSMHTDGEHVMRALRAGASGYIAKRSAAREVIEAVRTVSAGRRYLHEPLATELLRAVSDPELAEDPLARLSSRERQVLQQLAEGRSGAEIAAALSLSPRTVETYRARMMQKLGVHELAGLVRFAIQRGLVPLE